MSSKALAEKWSIHTKNAFKDIILAPPGKVIMNADWSQLELWVLAYLLEKEFGDTILLDVLLSGRDVHTFAARGMWPDRDPELPDNAWRAIHKDLRNQAKPFVYGTNYGLTVEGTMERLHCDKATAEDLIKRYERNVLPALPRYKVWIRENLFTNGYVEDMVGRRRHSLMVPILRAMGEKMELEGLFRENLNMPIQAGGSDLHAYTSVETDLSSPLASRGCFTIFSVHDSLTFLADAPDEEYAVATAWTIKDLWKNCAWNMPTPSGEPLHWQVPAEVEWGARWGTPTRKLTSDGRLVDLTKEEED